MLDGLVPRAWRLRLRRPKVYDLSARSKAPVVRPRSTSLRRRCLHQQQVADKHSNTPQVVYSDDACVALRSGAPRAALHLLLLPRQNPLPGSPQHDEVLAHMVITGARLGTARASGFRLVVEGAGTATMQVHVMSDTPN